MVETSTSTWRFHHHRLDLRRWIPTFFSSHKTLFAVLWIVAFASVFVWQRNIVDGFLIFRRQPPVRAVPRLRSVAFNLTDFGGVGDGVTINTQAFERAVSAISKLGKRGGAQLNVPAGTWLTAPFNLTSHMTLFLAQDAVILGLDDEKYWPLMPPLPSYGKGREHPGPRYGSLIHGQNLKDVVITGHNGTINGQGQTWWKKYRQKLLNHTRGPLVQIMWSSNIVISNITLRDSPFWTLHPYDCKNVTVKNVTILAPIFEAPNTDGIDPDSCEDMVIEDCYISVGDDGIAIKSGWDQYGIAYGRPSTNIFIRNLVVRSMVSAGVSIGSEMSGGVSNVTVENLHVWDSRRAVRIKTSPGRGGYVRNVIYRNLTFDNVRVGIVIKTDYNEHPDEGFDPKAVPVLEDISYTMIHGEGVRVPVRIHGSEEIPVRNVSFRDMSVGITYKKKHIFQCAFVEGRLCCERALAAFGLDSENWGVNVQPYSCTSANFAVYTGLLLPGDRIMGLDTPSGGNTSHGYYTPNGRKVSGASIFFESLPYKVNPQTGYIDYDKLEERALDFRPKILICGGSSYPREWDYARLRQIADRCGAVLMCDMAQISGLIAAKECANPFDYCDIVTSTTHKSLRGPRGGIIFYRKGSKPRRRGMLLNQGDGSDRYDFEEKINFAVFPALQGGPHNNHIAALAVALKQVATPEYKAYMHQVKKNAQALASALLRRNFKLVTGGTDNHLILWDLRTLGLTGKSFERICEMCRITLNKVTIFDDNGAITPGGVRIGTPAMTSRGCLEGDFEIMAGFLHRAAQITCAVLKEHGKLQKAFPKGLQNNKDIIELRICVENFATQFAMPGLDA